MIEWEYFLHNLNRYWLSLKNIDHNLLDELNEIIQNNEIDSYLETSSSSRTLNYHSTIELLSVEKSKNLELPILVQKNK